MTNRSGANTGSPGSFLRGLNKTIDYCILALAAIAGAVVLFLLLAVCVATLSRYLFNKPFAFLIDYSAYSLLFIAFLGAPWLLQTRGHVSIDMLVDALPAWLKPYWCALVNLVIILISAVICYIGFTLTRNNIVNHVLIADFLSTPKWVVSIPIPVSAFFLTIQAIRNLIADFHNRGSVKEGGAA